MVPFISQIAAWPLVFCHRMSEWPSPLKSPVPIAFQLGPGLGPPAAADHVGPVHFPDCRLTARVLPQNVGMDVDVEVGGRIGRRRGACNTTATPSGKGTGESETRAGLALAAPSVEVAVKLCGFRFASAPVAKVHAPLLLAVAVPNLVELSKTAIVLLAAAAPFSVTILPLTVSLDIVGAAGAVVSICGPVWVRPDSDRLAALPAPSVIVTPVGRLTRSAARSRRNCRSTRRCS